MASILESGQGKKNGAILCVRKGKKTRSTSIHNGASAAFAPCLVLSPAHGLPPVIHERRAEVPILQVRKLGLMPFVVMKGRAENEAGSIRLYSCAVSEVGSCACLHTPSCLFGT